MATGSTDMRIALLSDLHANLRATQACLAHARAQGAGRVAVLGDLVGYGAEPAEAARQAVAEQQAERACAQKASHEAALAHRADVATGVDPAARTLAVDEDVLAVVTEGHHAQPYV